MVTVISDEINRGMKPNLPCLKNISLQTAGRDMKMAGHGTQRPIQDCLDIQITGAVHRGNYYHLFVSDCSLNHLKGGEEENLFLPPCLTDEWDIIPGSYSEDRDIIVPLGQQKTQYRREAANFQKGVWRSKTVPFH